VIDWLTLLVPIADGHQLAAGRVVSVDADGTIEWFCEKRVSVRGSYDASVTIRRTSQEITTQDGARYPVLEVAGSPAKFLQGHNAFGSNDLHGLHDAMLRLALRNAGLRIDAYTENVIRAGGAQLLRVDLNESFSCGSRREVLAWIRAAALHGRVDHRKNGGLLSGTTVSWGRKSRYWQIKAYSKGQEIEAPKHRLPLELRGRGIEAWADDKLRVEVQLNARHLRRLGLREVSAWQTDTPARVYSEHLAKLKLSGDVRMTRDDLDSLPLAIRTTYELWASGADVRSLCSKAKFYRHRAQLLKHGVDLAVPAPSSSRNVVPLIRYIEAQPAQVPDWAQARGLTWSARKAG
jgi:II/X family phage/plasmid replication protein